MIEMLDFFASISTSRQFHFEPLYECGRCRYSGWRAPKPEVFATEFMRTWKYAMSHSINLSTSLARLEHVGSTFCGAAGNNFIVTPDGYVTACLEVSTLDDERAGTFIYGNFDPESQSFTIDREKLEFLALRNTHNMTACGPCPIKWHCAGDCLVKALDQGDMFDPTQTGRCYSAQRISTKQLYSMLAEPELGHKKFLPTQNLIC